MESRISWEKVGFVLRSQNKQLLNCWNSNLLYQWSKSRRGDKTQVSCRAAIPTFLVDNIKKSVLKSRDMFVFKKTIEILCLSLLAKTQNLNGTEVRETNFDIELEETEFQ